MAENWKDISDEREKYAAYLCSREWSVLKEAVHARAYGLCERCFTRNIDAVHHLTYARKYCERLDDLQGLCNGCHEFTHGKRDDDPREIEDREVKFCRVIARQSDLYLDVGDWVASLENSIAMSVWKGLCTADDVRRVIDRALECGQRLRQEDEEAKDGR